MSSKMPNILCVVFSLTSTIIRGWVSLNLSVSVFYNGNWKQTWLFLTKSVVGLFCLCDLCTLINKPLRYVFPEETGHCSEILFMKWIIPLHYCFWILIRALKRSNSKWILKGNTKWPAVVSPLSVMSLMWGFKLRRQP